LNIVGEASSTPISGSGTNNGVAIEQDQDTISVSKPPIFDDAEKSSLMAEPVNQKGNAEMDAKI